MENGVAVLQKLGNTQFLYDLAILYFWEYSPKNWKQGFKRELVSNAYYSGIICISQTIKMVQMSPDRYMDKQNVVCTLNRTFSLKKATVWVNSEDIVLSEMRQLQKDKYCTILITWAT